MKDIGSGLVKLDWEYIDWLLDLLIKLDDGDIDGVDVLFGREFARDWLSYSVLNP